MKQKRGVVWLIAVIILLWILRISFPDNRFVSTTFSYVSYPFIVVQHKICDPIKNLFNRVCALRNIEKECVELKTKLDDETAENVRLRSETEFVAKTKELVRFSKRYDVSYGRLAHVIMKSFSPESAFFLVDAGAKAGVEENMVAVYKNCLVGRISEVYPYYSKVILTTDRTCHIAACTAGTGSCGICEGGNGSDGLVLTHVSHLTPVKKGDKVISSGEGLIFPRGFGLGRVVSLSHDEVLYTAVLEPMIDAKTLDYCYIIQKGEAQSL